MRIGILGGTFDPPHIGHLALAKAAQEQLELDEVIWLPANRNPLKSRRVATAGNDRLEMVKRIIEDEEKMAVSDMELTRGGISYTVDTLGELQMVQPAEYWFLLGADAVRGLAEWKNPQRLIRLCRFGVAIRPPVTETDVLSRLPQEFKEKVDIVKMSPLDVSSTEIRDRIARRQGTAHWVPARVQRYISDKKLYV